MKKIAIRLWNNWKIPRRYFADEYNLLNVRNKRTFDIVIVDEIDNMLID